MRRDVGEMRGIHKTGRIHKTDNSRYTGSQRAAGLGDDGCRLRNDELRNGGRGLNDHRRQGDWVGKGVGGIGGVTLGFAHRLVQCWRRVNNTEVIMIAGIHRKWQISTRSIDTESRRQISHPDRYRVPTPGPIPTSTIDNKSRERIPESTFALTNPEEKNKSRTARTQQPERSLSRRHVSESYSARDEAVGGNILGKFPLIWLAQACRQLANVQEGLSVQEASESNAAREEAPGGIESKSSAP
ncbi:hypothetical protein B0H12DRAFT_1072823 [Mycena haematopus]|nr:hypothetical protein B0H12DRAFT_1072823 [Mycena haematopus]